MWGTLVGGLSGRLSERAILRTFTPAFLFWLALSAAIAWHDESLGWGMGLTTLVPGTWDWPHQQFERFTGLEALEQAAVAIGVVTASTFIAEMILLRVLQVAEGYWPRWLSGLQTRREVRRRAKITADRQELRDLGKCFGKHSAEEQARYRDLDWRLEAETPKQEEEVRATRLGDILRAAETRPTYKYGLDVLICWPRLWLVLPDGVRTELTEARDALNAGVRIQMWAVLSLVIGIWGLWVVPLSVFIAFVAYRVTIREAKTYGLLLESTFDVHRKALYESLRWPLPTNPIEEVEAGAAINRYLWRGAPKRDRPTFTGADNND